MVRISINTPMQSISDLERRLEELPILPTVIVRLLALDTGGENYFEQVLELAQEDPTFALRIIRLSNSATSAPVNPITSLREAVVRLGVKTVTEFVRSMAVMRIFLPTTVGEKSLWVHSIQVAVGAKLIAQVVPALKVNPEQAYLCGLLHDIGRFVLFDRETDQLNMIENTHWQTPVQLVESERELYGYDHSELGKRVCEKWALPQIITDVVAKHHEFDLPDRLLADSSLAHLIRIVQMADFFSVLMLLNPDAMNWESDVFEQALHDRCVKISSSVPPLSVKQLHVQASRIINESNKKVSALGLGTWSESSCGVSFETIQ